MGVIVEAPEFQNRRFLSQCDVRNAYDSVPQQTVQASQINDKLARNLFRVNQNDNARPHPKGALVGESSQNDNWRLLNCHSSPDAFGDLCFSKNACCEFVVEMLPLTYW